MKNSVENSVWRICSRRCPPRCGTSTPPRLLTQIWSSSTATTTAPVSYTEIAVSRRRLLTQTSTSYCPCVTVVTKKNTQRAHQKRRKGGWVVVSPCQGHGPLPQDDIVDDCLSSVTRQSDNRCVTLRRSPNSVVNTQDVTSCGVSNNQLQKTDLMYPL
ncbi:unnamed protein product [Orchesella dallaii]|uniref:Uncharacterized protein n=1 Tax=Orchesella dallaii TaxID=48710 RepID=A0ABP1PR67_9HEXA